MPSGSCRCPSLHYCRGAGPWVSCPRYDRHRKYRELFEPVFTMVTHVATFPLEKQLTLQLRCMGSRSKITHGACAQLSIRAFSAHVYFDVVNINQYNCILGIPFLQQNTAVVDCGQQKLHIGWGKIPMLQDTKATPTRPSCMHVLGKPPWYN